MNLRQLRYFYETAKNQSLAKTAKKYMVPASSVSAAIKKLEDELGVRLFDRTSNKIILNSRGRIFASELMSAFDRIDSAVDKVTSPEQKTPKIRILVKARPKWIAELIVEYMSTNPNVNFIISNDYKNESIDDFDIVIDEPADKYSEWKQFLLSVELLCVKAAKNSRFIGKELRFENLKNEDFIFQSQGNSMRNRYERICKRLAISPNVAIECNDRQLLQYYVQSGLGLTIGTYRALNDNTQNAIAPLTVVDFNETQNVCVFYKNPQNRNTDIKDFCDFLYTKRYI